MDLFVYNNRTQYCTIFKIHILFYLITTITVTTVMDIFYVYLFKEFHHRYLLLKKPTK